MSSTTSTINHRRPTELELTRGVSEISFDGASATIKVPSCKPTPLIGTWADESWPLNSRQASEIITEHVLQQQRSSIVFEDDNGNILMNGEEEEDDNQSSSQGDSITHGNESMLHEAMSHAQITSEISERSHSDDPDSPTHVAQSYMYDPYNIHDAYTVLCRCTCEVCYAALQRKAAEEEADATVHQDESVSQQVTPAAPKTVDNSSPVQTSKSSHSFLAAPPEFVQTQDYEDGDNWDLPTYGQNNNSGSNQYAAAPAPATHQFPAGPNAGGFMTHTQISSPPFMEQVTPTPSPGQMNATPGSNVSGLSHPPPTQRRTVAPDQKPVPQPREISTFMPPPPPPRIATLVYEEEKSIKNPSGVYYHLIMRWYSKVQESQEYFVTPDCLCPAPNKAKYSFDEWADEVSGWWNTQFEHMQKKQVRFAGRRH